ncbi:hypothetical protein K466DRAFT_310661 [Polyporus arcularius HHB13444]|uniref:Uncharacterized protein n=1 Tax=Polyporus arcularius HHB13444 TaxID=1314778 RepID=A0A5C3PUT0_9APHY|nr:hypothetical protein K466DRAFT_310661 [Polyporus arcularius HHB13444]
MRGKADEGIGHRPVQSKLQLDRPGLGWWITVRQVDLVVNCRADSPLLHRDEVQAHTARPVRPAETHDNQDQRGSPERQRIARRRQMVIAQNGELLAKCLIKSELHGIPATRARRISRTEEHLEHGGQGAISCKTPETRLRPSSAPVRGSGTYHSS